MKTLEQWFAEYNASHQNRTNTRIHFFSLPLIYFSVIGLFMSIDPIALTRSLNLENPFVENWGTLLVAVLLLFYILLSIRVALKMFLFSILCIIVNHYLSLINSLFYSSLSLFLIAFILHLYGYFIEEKKPLFLKDLRFLLIGPAWVIKKIFGKDDQ